MSAKRIAASTPSRSAAVDGDLGRQRGVLAEFQERDLRPDLAVLGHVPARLPHQPDRRDVGRLAAAGLEEPALAERRRRRMPGLGSGTELAIGSETRPRLRAIV